VKGVRRTYGRPRHRVAYDRQAAAEADAKLAHTEVVAGLEWLERGHVDTAVDRLHLAYRFIGELLVREGRIEQEDADDETNE
jgi:hypothetical protein